MEFHVKPSRVLVLRRISRGKHTTIFCSEWVGFNLISRIADLKWKASDKTSIDAWWRRWSCFHNNKSATSRNICRIGWKWDHNKCRFRAIKLKRQYISDWSNALWWQAYIKLLNGDKITQHWFKSDYSSSKTQFQLWSRQLYRSTNSKHSTSNLVLR